MSCDRPGGSLIPSIRIEVTCSAGDLLNWFNPAPRLSIEAKTLSSPEFFLASLTAKWKPRVVAIKRDRELIGLIYARERTIRGIRTGILHLDTTLGGSLLSAAENEQDLFFRALSELMKPPSVRALRLVVPPHGPEFAAARQLVHHDPLDFGMCELDVQHRRLQLAASYEAFLNNLGKQTRRNFRYYRRRFEADSHEFCDDISVAEFFPAAQAIMAGKVVGQHSVDLSRAARLLRAAKSPLIVGLRRRDGKWLSILSGWYERDQAVVFAQVNSDKEYPQYSLSSVLRAYLCEKLIGDGVREIIFWGGVVGPLHRYSELLPGICLYLDKRDWNWRAFRSNCKRDYETDARSDEILRMMDCSFWLSPAQDKPILKSNGDLGSNYFRF